MFYYERNIFNDFDKKIITRYLNNIDDFKCNPKSSNTFKAGRLQKWYQKYNKYFCPLWKLRHDWWESFDYDSNLLYFQNIIQNKLLQLNYNVDINSCLINKYRDGNDYIAPHRDSKLSFGDNPIIAILSIGQKRTLRFTKVEKNHRDKALTKKDKSNIVIDYELEDNSLFVMSGDSQTCYSHQLLKDNSDKERYSLTFRHFIL
jgi:alkylated DNA repair dioxygenase AlkB